VSAFCPLGGGGRPSGCGSFFLCTAGFVGCRSCLRVSDLCVGVGLAWASLGWLKAGRSLRRRSCISGAAGAVSPACAVSALRQLVARLGALRHRRRPGDHLPQLGQVLHHLRHHSSHTPHNTPSGQTPPRNRLNARRPHIHFLNFSYLEYIRLITPFAKRRHGEDYRRFQEYLQFLVERSY